MAPDYSAIFGNQNWVDTFNGTPEPALPTPTMPAAPGADQSGWNLQPDDPYYGFYNAPEGRRAGVDWWYADDRNNPALHPELMTGPTAYQPVPYSPPGAPPPDGTPAPPPPGGGGGPMPPIPNYTKPADADVVTPYQPPPGGSPTGTPAPGAPPPGGAPPAPGDYKGQYDPIIAAILGRGNTGEGFSPDVLSALRTQATSGIPKLYEDAARKNRTDLLRSGAIGAGELPGTPADILRTMAPLDQARADAVSGANRDTILKNEAERKRTLDLNRTNAQDLLTNLFQAGSQKDIAQLSADTQLKLGQLTADTQKTIANLDADTQKWMGTLSSDTQKALAALSATTQTDLGKLDAATRLKVAELDNAPGSLKSILLSGLLSSFAAPGAGGQPSLISKGLGGLIDLVTGKPNDAAKAAVEAALGVGALGPLLPSATAGTVAAAAGAPLTGYAGGGLVTSHGALIGMMTNPITIGVAGALVAGAMWLKSQAKWEANTMVQKFENPFHENYLAPFVKEFTDAYSSGKLTKQDALGLRASFAQNWEDYVKKAREFGQKGKDEKQVSDQSIMNLYKVAILPIMGTIDKAIGSLA